jgi:16S rRNA (guanine527-N7)-methyltransferase
MPDPSALLLQGLGELAVPEPDRAARLLESYMDEIERWNPRFGLVSVKSREELLVRHVLDSIAGWAAVRNAAGSGGTVLDAGSGAGLPGIPLAVALPGLRFRLVERMARRCAFLRTCALLLPLPTVTVEESDTRGAAGECDVITFRAYAPLDRFVAESLTGGPAWKTLVAYKGRRDRVDPETDAALALLGPGSAAEVTPLRVPFLDEERCLVILRRTRR